MKKLISIILVICVLLGCVACTTGSTPPPADNDQVATDRYMLSNGKTDYKIVLSEDANDYHKTAASELSALFYEATGVQLQTITDTNLTHTADGKYFSIGYTSLFNSADIDVDAEATLENGFQLTTKDDTLYLVGGKKNGVLFGVYEFLFRTLHFEQFSADCYSLDKAVTEIPLYNFNIVDSPDFKYAKAFAGYLNRNPGVTLRMKYPYTYNNGFLMTYEGKDGHNTLNFVKPSEYMEEHPGWFSYPDNSQLCYTARGDEAEYELLVDAMVKSLKDAIRLESNQSKFMLAISGMDNASCCSCETCYELRDKYNSNTAQFIWFLNDCHDKLMDWFKNDEEGKTYYKEDFRLKCSFYEAYTDAPAKYNETTKTWEPIDDSVVLNEGIVASIAPIHSDFQRPMTHPNNINNYNQIQKMAACSREQATWWYCTNFHAYMFPFDCYSSMQPNYQMLHELGFIEILDETQNGNNGGMTGFHMFQAYLAGRLMWNVYDDQEELTKRFFKGYFMDAAEDMLKYFNSYRNFSQIQMSGLAPGMGSIYFQVAKKEYWPKPVIDEWQGYVASALEKIEKYKNTDPVTYDMLYKHITMERVFLDYVYLQYYKANLGSDFIMHRDRFIADFRLNDITLTKEGSTALLENYAQQLMEN